MSSVGTRTLPLLPPQSRGWGGDPSGMKLFQVLGFWFYLHEVTCDFVLLLGSCSDRLALLRLSCELPIDEDLQLKTFHGLPFPSSAQIHKTMLRRAPCQPDKPRRPGSRRTGRASPRHRKGVSAAGPNLREPARVSMATRHRAAGSIQSKEPGLPTACGSKNGTAWAPGPVSPPIQPQDAAK